MLRGLCRNKNLKFLTIENSQAHGFKMEPFLGVSIFTLQMRDVLAGEDVAFLPITKVGVHDATGHLAVIQAQHVAELVDEKTFQVDVALGRRLGGHEIKAQTLGIGVVDAHVGFVDGVAAGIHGGAALLVAAVGFPRVHPVNDGVAVVSGSGMAGEGVVFDRENIAVKSVFIDLDGRFQSGVGGGGHGGIQIKRHRLVGLPGHSLQIRVLQERAAGLRSEFSLAGHQTGKAGHQGHENHFVDQR